MSSSFLWSNGCVHCSAVYGREDIIGVCNGCEFHESVLKQHCEQTANVLNFLSLFFSIFFLPISPSPVLSFPPILSLTLSPSTQTGSHRLRHFDQQNEEGEWYINNDVFSVTLDSQLNPHQRLPMFGAKYLFKLHGVVNVPEFVVYFPLLER